VTPLPAEVKACGIFGGRTPTRAASLSDKGAAHVPFRGNKDQSNALHRYAPLPEELARKDVGTRGAFFFFFFALRLPDGALASETMAE